MDFDRCLHLHDASGDFDEAQAQRVELRRAPEGTLWRGHAQAPHDPVGPGVQEEPQLIGNRLRTGGSIPKKAGFPRFDMFSAWPRWQ